MSTRTARQPASADLSLRPAVEEVEVGGTGGPGEANLPGEPPIFELGESLGYLVGQVAKRMGIELNAALAHVDLTAPQWAALTCLQHDDGLTQIDLAQRLGMDTASLAEMLKRMGARGLIRRHRDESNNRYQRVFLANYDPGALAHGAAEASRVNTLATNGFDSVEAAQLVALLKRALVNFATPRPGNE